MSFSRALLLVGSFAALSLAACHDDGPYAHDRWAAPSSSARASLPTSRSGGAPAARRQDQEQALEGNWVLTGGTQQGQRKTVAAGKAFVYRFSAGEFSIPVQGGLPDSAMPPNALRFQVQGEELVLSRQNDGEIRYRLISLAADKLILRPHMANPSNEVEFEFSRIDDAAMNDLRSAPRE